MELVIILQISPSSYIAISTTVVITKFSLDRSFVPNDLKLIKHPVNGT